MLARRERGRRTGLSARNNEKETITYFPRRTCRLIVWVLLFHRSIYFAYRQTFLGAAEDGAAKDNGERVLWAAIGVGEACQGIGAIGVWFVWSDGDVGLAVVVLLDRALGGYGCWR